MKLQLELDHHRLPLRSPLSTARGPIHAREGWTVRVRDARGREGVGEASPLPGWSAADVEAVGAALAAWTPRWSPEAPEAGLPELPEARFAAEQAMASLYAAEAGLPLPVWLSDGAEERVPVNALVRGPDDVLAAVKAGFGTLKLKVGARPAEDRARVAAVRAVVRPQVALRLDANQGWTPQEAQEALRLLAPYGVEAVEEPCPGGPAVWRALGSPVPLAVDESCRTEADLDPWLAEGGADAVVIKPALVGGLRRSLRLAQRARRAGLAVWVTTTLDGAIGRRGALAVALATPGVRACGLATGALLADDLGPDLIIEGGFARWT